MNNKIAVILIRGTIGTHPDVKRTLELLRLKKKHSCVVIEDNDVTKGMLQKVKDYVTFGKIDSKTFKLMLDKRGELVGQAKVSTDKTIDTTKIAEEFFKGSFKLRELEEKYLIKPFFRLAPPIKGFERKGIKTPFAKGGVLGNRDDKISILIEKML